MTTTIATNPHLVLSERGLATTSGTRLGLAVVTLVPDAVCKLCLVTDLTDGALADSHWCGGLVLFTELLNGCLVCLKVIL